MSTDGGSGLIPGDESHPDRVHLAVENNYPIAGAEEVSTSWRRCLSEYGVDPGNGEAPRILTARELREAREPVEELVAGAKEENDRLHAIIGKVGYSVLFTSTEGVVVDFRGDRARTEELKHWGIWKGGIWAENVEGTNGIGTCIAEERPVTVHRAQHFRTRHTSLSCCGAPVFGPDGRIAAVLDVTSIDPDVSERSHALALVVVMDSARAIEENLFRRRFHRAWSIFIAVPFLNGESLKLAVDEDLQIVGAGRFARLTFGLDDQMLAAGVSLWALFERVPLLFRPTREIMTAQFTRIGGNQPWRALILPPETMAPDAQHALLQTHSHMRRVDQFSRELAVPGTGGVERAKDLGIKPEIATTLSPREAAILDLIGKGQSNKQIARQLSIAPETVKTHVKHLFAKLEVERRAHAVSRAQNLGLMKPG
jgi:transcriptional regulator of acetoin/glycerol metabolism/DNA-binding CsgD family transcriptional regulator